MGPFRGDVWSSPTLVWLLAGVFVGSQQRAGVGLGTRELSGGGARVTFLPGAPSGRPEKVPVDNFERQSVTSVTL